MKDALNHVEEEHHAIIKYMIEKENEIIQKKDPFLKTVEDMCRTPEGWKHVNNHNWAYDANDRLAFATTDKGGNKSEGKNKK